MRHSFLDQYSHLNSLVHRIDPRIKVLTFFTFIGFIIFTPLESSPTQMGIARFIKGFTWPEGLVSFCLYGAILGLLVILSRLPIGFVLKRSFGVIPFCLVIALFVPFIKGGEPIGAVNLGPLRLELSYEGVLLFWKILIKAYLSGLCMILLSATTRFSYLLKALERLKMPKIFIMILSFMYRYIFVLVDELFRMNRARESRQVKTNWWLRIKSLAHMVGVLFIRAYERAERIYCAMCSRGFQGQIITQSDFHVSLKDVLFLASIILPLSLIRLLG